jgi:hypothetical protein
MYQHGLNLNMTKECLLLEGPVVHIESDERLFRCNVEGNLVFPDRTAGMSPQ